MKNKSISILMAIIQKAYTLYKTMGIKAFSLFIYRRIFGHKTNSLKPMINIVKQGNGIEIGGPSSIFSNQGLLPIYKATHHLDNCNFQSNTLWNSNLQEGNFFTYHTSKDIGYQFIQDSIDLNRIHSETYDFLLSSHVLEHIANPIKALNEWKRIVKPNGHLILILPHKDGTFDHNRPTTTLEHFIKDHENIIGEDDLTHVEEILRLHDLSKDHEAGSYETFKIRSNNNYQNRSLHHHVFTTQSLGELIDYMNLKIISIEPVNPIHIILIAQKALPEMQSSNTILLQSLESGSFKSPFRSDKT